MQILNRPPHHSQVPIDSIHNSVLALQQDFPSVQWQFASDRRHAEWMTFLWLDRFWRTQNKKPKPKAYPFRLFD